MACLNSQVPEIIQKDKKATKKEPGQQRLETKHEKPRGHTEEPESDDSNGQNVQKCQSHLVTSENPETAVCALSGMQYHVSQSLGEALVPCFMAVVSSTVHYFRYKCTIYWILYFSVLGQENIL